MMINNSTNVNKTNNHLSPQIIEHNIIRNPDPGLGLALKRGRVQLHSKITTISCMDLFLHSLFLQHLLSPDEYSPPKKMIEFSRKQQEQKIVHNIKEEVDHLKRDQVDLEVHILQ